MGRPQVYATDEQRQAAKRASWQKYNVAHKAERAAHNKMHCQRDDVKAKGVNFIGRKSLKRSIPPREIDSPYCVKMKPHTSVSPRLGRWFQPRLRS